MLVIRKDQLGDNDVVRISVAEHQKIDIMLYDTQRGRYVVYDIGYFALLPERREATTLFHKLVNEMRADRIAELPNRVMDATEEIERSVYEQATMVTLPDCPTIAHVIPELDVDTKKLAALLKSGYVFGGSGRTSLKRLITIISQCALPREADY